jgi:hypothetical protein
MTKFAFGTFIARIANFCRGRVNFHVQVVQSCRVMVFAIAKGTCDLVFLEARRARFAARILTNVFWQIRAAGIPALRSGCMSGVGAVFQVKLGRADDFVHTQARVGETSLTKPVVQPKSVVAHTIRQETCTNVALNARVTF